MNTWAWLVQKVLAARMIASWESTSIDWLHGWSTWIYQMIKWFAVGLSSQVTSWKGYDINGYLFYIAAKCKKTVSQNSGVCIDPLDERAGQSITYFGVIDDIREVHYGSNIQILIFRCRWVNTQKVLRWMAMDSRLSTSTMLVIKMTHGYLPHRLHRCSIQLSL